MFLKNNIYGSRGVHVRSLYTDKSNALLSFVKENSIKYIIGVNDKALPSCIVLNKIGDINQKKTIGYKIFSTKNKEHPGLKKFLFNHDYFIDCEIRNFKYK